MKKRLLMLALGLAALAALGLRAPQAQAFSQVSRERQGATARNQASAAWQASYTAEAAGKLDDALAALDELPGAGRTGYFAQFRRGWLHYLKGSHADSVTAYRSAVSQEPAAVEARVGLQLPLMALAKWQELTQVAQEVLELDPENYLTLQRLALAKFNLQRYPEAEALYRRVLLLYPSDLEMRVGLGWTLLRMGKPSEASAAFTQVLDVTGYHASAMQGLQEATTPKAAR
jgi:tetratricopeptide (TPR) repeat protein